MVEISPRRFALISCEGEKKYHLLTESEFITEKSQTEVLPLARSEISL